MLEANVDDATGEQLAHAVGVLLEFSQTLLGKSHHLTYGNNSPFFLLKNYAVRVVPRALFGERSLGGAGADYRGYYAPLHILNMAAHDALIACAWLVVLVLVAIAAFRFTDPNWTLAGVCPQPSLSLASQVAPLKTQIRFGPWLAIAAT